MKMQKLVIILKKNFEYLKIKNIVKLEIIVAHSIHSISNLEYSVPK